MPGLVHLRSHLYATRTAKQTAAQQRETFVERQRESGIP